ncbi:hypothetical protein E5288_WYG002471 [Bos mutus]|uniref:Uncharacterized protein n=1 Tax=Bos mutus TaxID=72004 RepID=A0A6B0R8G3_9CETA|nr:hypothetical protein [Bos mutus]
MLYRQKFTESKKILFAEHCISAFLQGNSCLCEGLVFLTHSHNEYSIKYSYEQLKKQARKETSCSKEDSIYLKFL